MDRQAEKAGGYRFEYRRRDVATAPPDLAHLLEVWREHAGAGWLPHPRNATFDAFLFMIGRVHLVEIGTDGALRFRLYGTGSCYPIDAHKRTTASIRPRGLRAQIEAGYRDCIAEGRPVYCEIAVIGPRRSACLRRLLLPYASDGRVPDLIVAGFEEEPGLADIFRDPVFRTDAADLVLEDPD